METECRTSPTLFPPTGNSEREDTPFCIALLVLVTFLLVPAWRNFFGTSEFHPGDLPAGAYLPAAMGFLLALYGGGLDLSIWAVMGAGGLAAAGTVHALSRNGNTPLFAWPACLLAAMLVGTVLGGLNRWLVHRSRRSGLGITALITALTGLIVLAVCQVSVPCREVTIPDEAFGPWVSVLSDALTDKTTASDRYLEGPLPLLRMLTVFLIWTGAMAARKAKESWPRRRPASDCQEGNPPGGLCVSGMLAGASGACWLIDTGSAAVPTRLIDGLTVPVAVMLAGGLFLPRRRGILPAQILLPPALLLTDVWEQCVWPISLRGYSPSLAALGIFALTIQTAIRLQGRYPPQSTARKLLRASGICSGIGLLLLGFSRWVFPPWRGVLIFSALLTGLAGAAGGVGAWIADGYCRRRSRT